MNQARRNLVIVVTCVVVLLAAAAIAFGTHIIGKSPARTVEVDGGTFETGASAGRAWASYNHPDKPHRAIVKGKGEAVRSECVAPGKIARVTTEQSSFGRSQFAFEFC